MKLLAIPLCFAAVAACTGGSTPHANATYGGVIEVHFDTASSTTQAEVQRACQLDPLPSPASLSDHARWYRDPGGAGRAAALKCLHGQKPVTSEALPL